MYRTLKQLQDSISNLIEQQGENALVAGFIFTKEDVQVQEENDDDFDEMDCDDLEESHPGIVSTVLEQLGSSDYLYGQAFEIIEDEIRRVRNAKKLSTNY